MPFLHQCFTKLFELSSYDGILRLVGCKISPVTGLDRPRGFQEQQQRMVVGCQPYIPAAFTPRKYSWYSFLLEAESTPGP